MPRNSDRNPQDLSVGRFKAPKFRVGDFVYPLGSRDKCEVRKVILEKDVYWYHCEHITKIFGGTHITREDLLVPAEDKPKEITVEFSIPNPAVKMPEKVVIMTNEKKPKFEVGNWVRVTHPEHACWQGMGGKTRSKLSKFVSCELHEPHKDMNLYDVICYELVHDSKGTQNYLYGIKNHDSGKELIYGEGSLEKVEMLRKDLQVTIKTNEKKKSLNEILEGLSKRMAVIQISQDCFNELLKGAQALANIDPVTDRELVNQGLIGHLDGCTKLELSPDGLNKDELERLLEVFEAGGSVSVGDVKENVNIAPNEYARVPGVYSEIATDGLVSRDSILDILKRQIWESAVEERKALSIEVDTEIMKSIESFVRPLKTPITTWTFRLKFPNGDEVEVPEPPKDQWVLKGTIIWDWPNKYMGIGTDNHDYDKDLIDEQAKCWWHDYKRRAQEENAQVLWSKFWEKIPEKKLEPEKPVWEFL